MKRTCTDEEPPSSSIIIDVKHEHARKEREMGNKVKFMLTMPCFTYLAWFSAALLVAQGLGRRPCHKSCRFYFESRPQAIGKQFALRLLCRNLHEKVTHEAPPRKCRKLVWNSLDVSLYAIVRRSNCNFSHVRSFFSTFSSLCFEAYLGSKCT